MIPMWFDVENQMLSHAAVPDAAILPSGHVRSASCWPLCRVMEKAFFYPAFLGALLAL
jgi:hypothetical protein